MISLLLSWGRRGFTTADHVVEKHAMPHTQVEAVQTLEYPLEIHRDATRGTIHAEEK